jgi:hypothetical protein
MQRPIYFCEGWFSAKKYAPEVWTEAQAKEAHINGSKYTVLVDSIERPFCIIDVMTSKFIGVDFLDENLREALTYQFQLVSPGRMFLTMAVHREFDGDDDKVAKATRYTFTEDGKLQIRRTTFLPDHSLEVAHGQADVSSNYEAVPEFGKYEAFMRMERQLS